MMATWEEFLKAASSRYGDWLGQDTAAFARPIWETRRRGQSVEQLLQLLAASAMEAEAEAEVEVAD